MSTSMFILMYLQVPYFLVYCVCVLLMFMIDTNMLKEKKKKEKGEKKNNIQYTLYFKFILYIKAD